MIKELIVHVSTSKDPPPLSPIWAADTGIITGLGKSHYWIKTDYICFHILSKGHGTVRTPSGEAVLNAGDMFCLWPGVSFEYYKSIENPWEVYWLHMTGKGAIEFAEACGFSASCVKNRPDDPKKVLDCFKAIFNSFGREKVETYLIVSELYRLFGVCAKAMTTAKYQLQDEKSMLKKATNLIDSGTKTAFNVTEIADILNISRVTLFHLFKENLGITPIQYIIRKRLERAKDLLLNTSMKLSVISTAAGFNNEKYFYRCFLKHENTTPDNWRRESKKSKFELIF